MIQLRLKVGEESQEFELSEDVISIGRSPENKIPLLDRKASRFHARIERIGSTYRISDLESKNGVRVNEQPALAHTLVQGDEIRIGETVLKVLRMEAPAAAPAPAPAAKGESPLPSSNRETEAVSARPPPALHPPDKKENRRAESLPERKSRSGLGLIIGAVLLFGVLSYGIGVFVHSSRTGAPQGKTPAPAGEPEKKGVVPLEEIQALQGHVREKHYGDALGMLKALGQRRDPERVAVLAQYVKDEMQKEVAALEEKGKKLEAGKDYDEAVKLYRSRVEHFKGTEHYDALSRHLAQLEAGAKAEPAK